VAQAQTRRITPGSVWRRTVIFATRLPTISAAVRALSLTSLVAQRDAGTGRRTLRAAASSGALAAWTAAADSAAAYPGMAACRGPARQMPLGAGARSPGPGSGSRTPTASGSSWPGFPPLAHCVVTGYQLRRQDDGPRAACTRGRRCQRHGNPEDPVGGRSAHFRARPQCINMQAEQLVTGAIGACATTVHKAKTSFPAHIAAALRRRRLYSDQVVGRPDLGIMQARIVQVISDYTRNAAGRGMP
jgi:hypothetical protein